MKKRIVFGLTLLLALALAACAAPAPESASSAADDATTISSAADTSETASVASADAVSSAAETTGGNVYTSDSMQISLQIPDGWKEVSASDTMVLLASPDYPNQTDNITILSVDNGGAALAVMDEAAFSEQFEAASGSYKVKNFQKTKIAGADGVTAEIETHVNGKKLSQHIGMLNHNGALVTITYTGVAQDLAGAFADGLRSLQFTK